MKYAGGGSKSKGMRGKKICRVKRIAGTRMIIPP